MRESSLIRWIERSHVAHERVLVPPGDDMALVRLDADTLLVAVDQLVDGRHVRLESTPLELVGRKAVTRCLSDVAAMAGRPIASLAAATLPPDFGEERATRLFEAMREIAAAYDAPLVGGDLAFHAAAGPPLVCSVTVLAAPGPRVVRRAGAQPGDGVYVTGCLGGTIGPDGLGHHLEFEPRIGPALRLAERLGDRLHAMIDLSDGLGRDIPNLCRLSSVSMEIDAAALPCRHGAGWREAVGDGEDYELCFAAAGEVPSALDDLPVTRIGSVRGADAGTTLVIDGAPTPWGDWGWEHRA